MGEDPRPLMDNSSQRGPPPMMRPPRGPFGPRGPPPGFRPRLPGDWGPRGPPPGMFGPRGHPPFGPRGPPPEWALRGPHPDFFRPRGPMDGPFRGPHGEFGPRGEKFPGEFSDFRGPRPDMFMGPRPFGMRPIGPADNGQFAEDDFGSADFNGLPGSAEGQQKKKKSKKKKKSSADDAKFPTQKAKDPVKAEDKEDGKDGEESDVDEDKLLASDDEDDSSSSSSSDSSDGDDTDNKGDSAPQLPMQAGGSRPGQRPPFRPPFSHINRFPGNQRFPGHQRFPGPRFPGQRFHRPPSNQQEPRIVHQQPPPRVVMADGSLQRPAVIQQPLHQSPQSVRIMQPGQVLVRQVIPGLAQPVLRAVTLQPGQVLPGQIPGQHLNIQNIAAMRPATTLLQQQQQQQHNLQLLIQQRNATPTSAGHVSGETTSMNGTEARLPKQLGGLQVANPGQVIASGLNQPQFSNALPGQQRPTLLPTSNALQTQLRPNAAGGQPMFIPSSGAAHGHPGQNLNATLQASQALILQQQQQLAAVQQQQLALQQQHQQQLLQQQQQQEYERRAQDQQRPDGKMLRPDARDNRRKRDDYHRGRRYNRSRSRSFSRSRSNSWSGSDSRSRSRSSRSRSGSRSLSGSRSRSRSWSSAEGSRSPSPQRRKGGRERYDQNARSSERYGRQNSQQHRQRGEQKHSYNGKDEQRYEELERQRLKERERRDRERDRDGGREKDYIPSKRRRDDRDGDGRDQMQDGRSNESRARRDERKDSSKSSARDHNTSKDQSRASSNPDIGNRVLISSLPASMSERKLKQLMQSVGEVENLKLSTTRHKALVAFTRSSTAVACRKKFHKYVIDNCKLLVEFA